MRMKFNFTILLTILSLTSMTLSTRVPLCSLDTFRQFLPKGYPSEVHNVETEDGYHLQVFRIQAKGTQITEGKPVVFAQHGITNSAISLVINDDQTFALVLADLGFDVWIGNNRGTKFSTRHRTLSPENPKFWDYSFQQMGEYDIPAFLKFVHQKTGQKIAYIGHSQGTTQMFAALSDPKVRPKVAPLLTTFYALAPVISFVSPLIHSFR